MILGIALNRINEFQKGKKLTIWNHIYPFKITKKTFKVKQIMDLTVSEFVDLQRFSQESNYFEFCCIFVKKFFWQTICIHNLESIKIEYEKQFDELKENHTWVFNPPMFGEALKETIADEYKKEFVVEFGYMSVLIEKVCGGDVSKFKEIEKWKVSEFMFWADYLSGQRIIETIK